MFPKRHAAGVRFVSASPCTIVVTVCLLFTLVPGRFMSSIPSCRGFMLLEQGRSGCDQACKAARKAARWCTQAAAGGLLVALAYTVIALGSRFCCCRCCGLLALQCFISSLLSSYLFFSSVVASGTFRSCQLLLLVSSCSCGADVEAPMHARRHARRHFGARRRLQAALGRLMRLLL